MDRLNSACALMLCILSTDLSPFCQASVRSQHVVVVYMTGAHCQRSEAFDMAFMLDCMITSFQLQSMMLIMFYVHADQSKKCTVTRAPELSKVVELPQ